MPHRLVSIVVASGFRDANGGGFRRPVARPNPAAVSPDDLARNRQSQTRVLTEALVRPIRIESLENSLQRMRRDSGAVIVDRDHDSINGRHPFGLGVSCRPLKSDAHDAARLGEGAGIVNKVCDDLC